MTFDYQAEAQLTKSDQFHGELVSLSSFKYCIEMIVNQMVYLDAFKKALFYGKNSDNVSSVEGRANCSNLTNLVSSDIIHSIIGKATEAGELLEALYAAMFDAKEFDLTNFREEIGDGLWYDAIGLEAIGSNFGEVQTINIAKLRARFPNKFTEFDANNRDLTVERKILENGE